MRILDARIDSLYWSARAALGGWYADAVAAQEASASARTPLPWRVANGHALLLRPHGMGRYRIVADAAEFQVRLTDSEHAPTVYVQLRSHFIEEVGAARAMAESHAAVRDIVGGPIGEASASRVDVFADFADFVLVAADRPGLVTKADICAYFRSGSDEFRYIRAGTDDFKVRIYRKDLDLQRKHEPRPVSWQGHGGAVTRVEVEADVKALRRFGIQSVEDALSSYGDLWRHGVGKYLVLRIPGPGPARRWPVRPEWVVVQDAGNAGGFPVNGLVPFERVKGDKVRVLRGLYGNLIGLGAHLGCHDLPSLLLAVPAEIAAVERGRSFAKEVDKRFAKFPKAVRLARLDSAQASAGAGRDAQCAPDPLQPDIARPTST